MVTERLLRERRTCGALNNDPERQKRSESQARSLQNELASDRSDSRVENRVRIRSNAKQR
jgi:hypothetical protein